MSKPLVRRFSFGSENKPLKKVLKSLDKKLNRYLTDRYAKMLPQRKLQLKPIQQNQSATPELSSV